MARFDRTGSITGQHYQIGASKGIVAMSGPI